MSKSRTADQFVTIYRYAEEAYNAIKRSMEERAKYQDHLYSVAFLNEKTEEHRKQVYQISQAANQKIAACLEAALESELEESKRLDVQAVQGAVGIINALGADMPPEQAGKLLEPFKGQAQPLSLLVKLLKKYRIAYKEEPWHEVDVKKLFDEALAYVNAPVEKAMDAIVCMNRIRNQVSLIADLLAIPVTKPKWDDLAEDAQGILARQSMGLG